MSHKQWYGNEHIQELLKGPFYGFKLGTGRAVEVDGAIRRWGQFGTRYFGEYIVCAGPRIAECLNAVLTPEEAEVAAKAYEGRDLADCFAAIFHGEGLELSPGYNDKGKPAARPTGSPF